MSAETSDGLLFFLKYPLLLLVYVFLLMVVRAMARSLPSREELTGAPVSFEASAPRAVRPPPREARAPVARPERVLEPPRAAEPAPAPSPAPEQAASLAASARLEVVDGMPNPPGGIPLDGPVVFGRSAGCTVRVPDPFVSSQHARLTPEPGGPILEDLGSRNGTYLGQQRIEGPVRLQDGDTFAVGDILFRYRGA